ncbi:hypothetical protein MLD38_005254 [Melastoma candidum]|uniref:Uncharacterized protein n=1 Tax=Melastoma candidum TaxID=119954 RepID=A0ACB9S862_9MYRT|nr:hypothetical protein MLD38_005254 [Melastoma candidum]
MLSLKYVCLTLLGDTITIAFNVKISCYFKVYTFNDPSSLPATSDHSTAPIVLGQPALYSDWWNLHRNDPRWSVEEHKHHLSAPLPRRSSLVVVPLASLARARPPLLEGPLGMSRVENPGRHMGGFCVILL